MLDITLISVFSFVICLGLIIYWLRQYESGDISINPHYELDAVEWLTASHI